MLAHVRCPNCGVVHPLPVALCGKNVRCPRCQHVFRVEAARQPTEEEPLDVLPADEPTAPAAIQQGLPSGVGRAPQPPSRRAAQAPPRPRKGPDAAGPGWPAVLWIVAGVATLVLLFLVGGLAAGLWWWLTRATPSTGPVAANHRQSADFGRPTLAPRPPEQGAKRLLPPAPQEEPRAAKPVVEVPGNLLVNGSFEEGPEPHPVNGFTTLPQGSTVIKGWEVSQGEIDYIGPFWVPADGRRSIDLNGHNRGTIRQTFKTRRGQLYRVTFAMAGILHEQPAVKRLRVSAAGASADFEFDSTGRSLGDIGWTTGSWDFRAVAEETTLEFASLVEGANGPALDRVSVVAVKE
jgi:choice-of-anchor C domain-containing protein